MQTTLQAGQVRPRPPRKRSQAHPGIHPISAFTHRTQRFQPLPPALGEPPYHYQLATSVSGIGDAKKIVFHTVGDTGGIKNSDYQADVARSIKGDLNSAEPPVFFYHLGDVVYYNGEIEKYFDQFYEPYDHYAAPIFSIPGNHDGDPIDSTQTSLDGWVRYFMSPTPQVRPESHDAPRVTLSLPNVYFTLECPLVTIVGMYANVPEHGSIDSVQQQWLTHEFDTAPEDKALILALHHPVYSFDDHHSGSPRMADAVQHAINESRRVPNLVLTAHVHNYQRIERAISKKTKIPFLVVGHGGYYHLHGLNTEPGDDAVDPETGAHLVSANDKQHGYVTVVVEKDTISGFMTTVADSRREGQVGVDEFSYPARPIKLGRDEVISL